MGAAEILWRVVERARLYYLWFLWKINRVRHWLDIPESSVFSFCNSNDNKLPQFKWDISLSHKAEEELLSGIYNALGYPWKWRNNNNCWSVAPDTGKKWPDIFFWNISYRHGNPYGDARVVWEPSRMQQLVSLALLARNSTDQKRTQATTLIENELLSWLEKNPPLTGIHYASAMECALRLIAVCHAYDMVRQYLGRKYEVSSAVLTIVISHAYFISHRLSLHSSSGNHTIAECVGLIYAGTLFPEYKGAARWKTIGLNHLISEAERQIQADGGGIEQAVCYQLFILDLLALAQELIRHYGEVVPIEIASAVSRGRVFINNLYGKEGELPAIGDSDSGYALSAYLGVNRQNTRSSSVFTIFKDSGYTIVRKTGNELINIIFDHGPLGMPPSYGHGHCDALSMILNVNGENLLIDPGTYTYTGEECWRTYFRSSRAHNTVTVDEQDPAKQESAFQWSRPYRAILHMAEQDDDGTVRLLASHDGYRRLGVIHWRYILLRPCGEILIMDHLSGSGKHTLELNWHLDKAPVEVSGHYILDEGVSLNIPGERVSLHCGEYDPISGWKSPVYGALEPSVTLKVRYAGMLPYEFITTIGINCSINQLTLSQEEKALARQWIR